MASSINNSYYIPRTENDRMTGFILATITSGGIMSGLALINKPFQNELLKEQPNNPRYKAFLKKAFDISGLKNKGVDIIEAQKNISKYPIEASGKNACYISELRKVVLNTDKISNAGFHELGHAMNDLMSKYGVKYLAKMRRSGYIIAAVMEYFALFSRTKPKEEKRNFTDFIEDNCGKIAFLAMLPVVAEEGIASCRGINLAKTAGMSKPLLDKLKVLYGKALLTYAGRAVLGGLAIGASRIIMDHFSRPRKIENTQFNFIM